MNRKLLLGSAAVILSISGSMASEIKGMDNDPHVRVTSTINIIEDYENPNTAIVVFNNVQEEPTEEKSIVSAVVNTTRGFVSTINDMTYEETKFLDQNGNKIAGQHAKTFVEHNVPFGSHITQVTGGIAKMIDPNADTLTEVIVKKVRSPLELPKGDDYPKTKEDIVGDKAKQAVECLPFGSFITAGTGFLGQKIFGTKTLTAGLVKLYNGSPEVQENNTSPMIETPKQEPLMIMNHTPEVTEVIEGKIKVEVLPQPEPIIEEVDTSEEDK